MRFAYADPPYVGQARKHYGREEVDHEALLIRLCDEYPDGWALSCSSPSLRAILPMCPADVRVAAWVKPFAIFKKAVRVTYAWEPIIWRGGRQQGTAEYRDWIALMITFRKGLVGAKPPEFAEYVLNLLGHQNGDTLDDLFPGTGIMGATASQGRIAL